MTSPLLVLERAVALSRTLSDAHVPHAFGGALALAYHVADPRGTNDIDVNITADPDRPEAVFRLLPPGITWTATDVTSAVRDGQVRLFWHAADELRTPVDVFLPQHEFHAVAAARTEMVPMLDADVPILSATDLAVFKALFDRLKDWADIEELLRYGEVDRQEVLRWLAGVVGADDERLARFRQTAQRVDDAPPAPTTADLFRRHDR